jgi:hypothetical protein
MFDASCDERDGSPVMPPDTPACHIVSARVAEAMLDELYVFPLWHAMGLVPYRCHAYTCMV